MARRELGRCRHHRHRRQAAWWKQAAARGQPTIREGLRGGAENSQEWAEQSAGAATAAVSRRRQVPAGCGHCKSGPRRSAYRAPVSPMAHELRELVRRLQGPGAERSASEWPTGRMQGPTRAVVGRGCWCVRGSAWLPAFRVRADGREADWMRIDASGMGWKG